MQYYGTELWREKNRELAILGFLYGGVGYFLPRLVILSNHLFPLEKVLTSRGFYF